MDWRYRNWLCCSRVSERSVRGRISGSWFILVHSTYLQTEKRSMGDKGLFPDRKQAGRVSYFGAKWPRAKRFPKPTLARKARWGMKICQRDVLYSRTRTVSQDCMTRRNMICIQRHSKDNIEIQYPSDDGYSVQEATLMTILFYVQHISNKSLQTAPNMQCKIKMLRRYASKTDREQIKDNLRRRYARKPDWNRKSRQDHVRQRYAATLKESG